MGVHMDRLPRTVLLKMDSGRMVFSYIDQRMLPQELMLVETCDWREVVDAIKTLAVRGAPAIGCAGAAAVALSVQEHRGLSAQACIAAAMADAIEIAEARPTAVNLMWAVEQMEDLLFQLASADAAVDDIANACFRKVAQLLERDEACNRAIGAHGSALLKPGSTVLTHCNAGSLATAFYGTALGVIYSAAEQGKIKRVYADETRPVGQGARLTVWELAQAGVPVTLLCDNMAASKMAEGAIDAVIVGADRIAANGDAANKIGTYGVAVLAHYHGIPFYVAAPSSTLDMTLASGADIPIEQRDSSEVSSCIPEGAEVWNPAFDVTPAKLIAGIITEDGVFAPDELSQRYGG